MPRYMTPDMPQVTLLMLQRLDDFENYILDAEGQLKTQTPDKEPESSRLTSKVQSQQVQLANIRGCIGALKNSVRMYRELWWKEPKREAKQKTG
jgi:hypothetical protein